MGSRMHAFAGTTALLTGGGTGVGAAVALALAGEGAALHLVGRRPQQLEAIASEARSLGVAATCHRADLSVASEQLELMQRLDRDVPQLDFLVQNAALHRAGPIEHGNAADLDALYHANVRAPYLLTQSFLPKLKA